MDFHTRRTMRSPTRTQKCEAFGRFLQLHVAGTETPKRKWTCLELQSACFRVVLAGALELIPVDTMELPSNPTTKNCPVGNIKLLPSGISFLSGSDNGSREQLPHARLKQT